MLALQLQYRPLWPQIGVGLAAIAILWMVDSISGNVVIDGTVAAFLGLYLTAQPARSTIDLLFTNRFALAMLWRGWSGRGWLALNGLVLLLGWAVLALGIVRLIGH
jgi:hypothetical protein